MFWNGFWQKAIWSGRQRSSCSLLRTRLQLTCENSCLTCEPHSSGALTPNPNANQRVWCLWSDAMNVCILLLMVLLYHFELASVIQMFVFMSERRKRRKTHFFRKARISKTLFSFCLACYQTVLAVVFQQCFLLGPSAASMPPQTFPNICAAILWHINTLAS